MNWLIILVEIILLAIVTVNNQENSISAEIDISDNDLSLNDEHELEDTNFHDDISGEEMHDTMDDLVDDPNADLPFYDDTMSDLGVDESLSALDEDQKKTNLATEELLNYTDSQNITKTEDFITEKSGDDIMDEDIPITESTEQVEEDNEFDESTKEVEEDIDAEEEDIGDEEEEAESEASPKEKADDEVLAVIHRLVAKESSSHYDYTEVDADHDAKTLNGSERGNKLKSSAHLKKRPQFLRILPERGYLKKVFAFHQSFICGLTIKNSKGTSFDVEYAIYNYGSYKCVNGKFVLLGCNFGTKTAPIYEIESELASFGGHSRFDRSEIGYCSQVADKYLYSGALNDYKFITALEKAECAKNSTKAIFYNYKLVTCEDKSFTLQGCLLDGIFVGLDILRKIPNFIKDSYLVVHKDLCVLYGRKHYQHWLKSRALLLGLHEHIDDGMDIVTVKSIKSKHEDIICNKLAINELFYKFGWYSCENGKLKLKHCVYRSLSMPVGIIQFRLLISTGDFINDTADIRFCGQVASEFIYPRTENDFHTADKTSEHENMWSHEDHACSLAASKPNSRIAIYSNFKLSECTEGFMKYKPLLLGCLFDHHFERTIAVQAFFRNRGDDIVDAHRDFCFSYGETKNYINVATIVKRKGHHENDQILPIGNCSVTTWKDGRIHYYVGRSASMYKRRLYNAIKEFEQNTCLKFINHRFKPRYINYINVIGIDGEYCYSDVGMSNDRQNRRQDLELSGPFCISHELGHAIGLHHEHQRPDRDNYLKMTYKELNFEENHDGNMYSCRSYHALNLRYDFTSMMHYDDDFADGINLHMKTRLYKYQNVIGNASKPSDCDYAKINQLYHCDPKRYKKTC